VGHGRTKEKSRGDNPRMTRNARRSGKDTEEKRNMFGDIPKKGEKEAGLWQRFLRKHKKKSNRRSGMKKETNIGLPDLVETSSKNRLRGKFGGESWKAAAKTVVGEAGERGARGRRKGERFLQKSFERKKENNATLSDGLCRNLRTNISRRKPSRVPDGYYKGRGNKSTKK